MNLTDALVLGILQGTFEWLPVSSEGITSLYLVSSGSTLADAIPVSIWLHTGTLLAAALYFRRDLKSIIKNIRSYIRRNKDTDINRVTTFLAISTVFTAITGLPVLLYSLDKLEFSGEKATAFIGILLVLTGLMQRKAGQKSFTEKKITKSDSIIAGIFQGFSAMPGLSRSGLTTSVLLLRRYDARRALKLSFLMSIPAVLAAELGLGLMKKISLDTSSLVMTAAAFIVGYITIGAMIKLAQKIRFYAFCILLGILCILPLVLGI